MRGKCSRYLIWMAVLLLASSAVLAAACEESIDTAETTTSTEATEPASGGGGAEVTGLVDNPATLTVEALETMTVVEITADHPKLGPTVYRGVLLSELFTTIGVQSGATAVAIAAVDGYMVEIPLADIDASVAAMLAIVDDGTLTVVIPGMEAKNWVKDVATIEFK
jgi:hypothetical protein